MAFTQPYAAQWKGNTIPGSFAHVLGHGGLAAFYALANGGSGGDAALSGAAAAGAEMAIPQLAQRLYGTSDPDKLTAEQKANLKTAAALFGTAVGGAGGNAVNAANAGSAAENALGNNWTSEKTSAATAIVTRNYAQLANILSTSYSDDEINRYIDFLQSNPDKRISIVQFLMQENSKHNDSVSSNSSSNNNNISTSASPMPPDPDDDKNNNRKNSSTASLDKSNRNQPDIKGIFNSIKDVPEYPKGFRDVHNGLQKVKIKNTGVLNELRKIEPGERQKVYRDGYDSSGNKISIHYFWGCTRLADMLPSENEDNTLQFKEKNTETTTPFFCAGSYCTFRRRYFGYPSQFGSPVLPQNPYAHQPSFDLGCR